jgi:hypothetical protein
LCASLEPEGAFEFSKSQKELLWGLGFGGLGGGGGLLCAFLEPIRHKARGFLLFNAQCHSLFALFSPFFAALRHAGAFGIGNGASSEQVLQVQVCLQVLPFLRSL